MKKMDGYEIAAWLCGIVIFTTVGLLLWQAGAPKPVEDEVVKMDLRELKPLKPPPGI